MAETGELEDQAPTPRKPRRGLAVLALLVSLIALSASGYLYWRLVWQAEFGLDSRFAELEATFARDLARLAGEDEAAQVERKRLADDLAAQVQVLASTRTALTAAASAAPRQAPAPAPRDWQLAEVEYLLRLANHRLRLEHDADGATDLLSSADEILADIDDFAFHDVRALLAEEMAALLAYEGADVQGVFLKIEAIGGLLDQLPLRLPEYAAVDRAQTVPASDPEPSTLAALLGRLEGLVRFRRHDADTRRPLLSPEEVVYLEQHLRLALERAQLAALRGDQAIFAASLTAARDWLEEFVDPSRDAVATVRSELDVLLAVDLATTPPDISGSLAKLRELRHGAGDGKS